MQNTRNCVLYQVLQEQLDETCTEMSYLIFLKPIDTSKDGIQVRKIPTQT